jgi:sugar transferase (PEP-CTERM/EpsH1 system associated)
MTSAEPPLIVHVVYSFAVGGLENGIVNLLNHLPGDRWRHAVLALTTVSADFARRLARPVELIEFRKPPGHLATHYPRLHALLRSLQPAVVHSRNLAALEAQVAALTAGVPGRIHGEHGWDANDPGGERRRYRVVRRLYRPFVQQYVALSRHLEAYLVERVGIRHSAVTQIYNGVDTRRFHPSPSGAREAIAGCPFTDPGLWLVGTAGRLDPVKDQVNLARAFVRAVRLDPEAKRRMRLVIAGDGTLRPRIEQALVEGGVRDLAWLAGERDDMPAILRGLDCFVLPSLGEGISNTILEAMATGLPVVATQVGGNAELVATGATGALVPAADSEALTHGSAGRVRAQQDFSLDRMVAEYDRLYERVLRPAPAGRAEARVETIGR